MFNQSFLSVEDLKVVTIVLSNGRKKYGSVNKLFENGDLEFTPFAKKKLSCEIESTQLFCFEEIVEIDPFMK